MSRVVNGADALYVNNNEHVCLIIKETSKGPVVNIGPITLTSNLQTVAEFVFNVFANHDSYIIEL